MGFPAGFATGMTAALAVSYLTVQAQNRVRHNQATVVRARSDAIETSPVSVVHTPYNPTIDPTVTSNEATADPPSHQYLGRKYQYMRGRQQPDFLDVVKDTWNREVQSAAQTAQETNWDEIRQSVEDKATVWWRSLVNGAQDTEQDVRQRVRDAFESERDKLAAMAESARQQAQSTLKEVEKSAQKTWEAEKHAWSQKTEAVREQVQEQTDAARQQAAQFDRYVGDTSASVRDQLERERTHAHQKKDEVERALRSQGEAADEYLRQRGEEVSGWWEQGKQKIQQVWLDEKRREEEEKAVREALEERYKPATQRVHLRGV